METYEVQKEKLWNDYVLSQRHEMAKHWSKLQWVCIFRQELDLFSVYLCVFQRDVRDFKSEFLL